MTAMYILYANVFEKSIAAIRTNDPREFAAVRQLVRSATGKRSEIAALAIEDARRGLPRRSLEQLYDDRRDE